MSAWQRKAHCLVAEDCFAAWRAANPPARRKHKPYSVPAQAQALVDCLRSGDEMRAKAIFLHRAEFGATEYVGG